MTSDSSKKEILLGPVATYLAEGSEGMIKGLPQEQVHHRPCLLIWPAGAREVLPDISAASHGRGRLDVLQGLHFRKTSCIAVE